MMDPIPGAAVDPARFAPFQPAKVLYDLDGPRTFTFLDREGELNLALWFDDNADTIRYFVVPFSDELLARLESGQISVREALEQPRLWIIDVNNEGNPIAATRTRLSDLPQEELPVPGTMLLPSLEPPGRFTPLAHRPVRLVGKVREVDADILRFTLRDVSGQEPGRECFFDKALWDDVHELLGDDVQVEVVGVQTEAIHPVRVAEIRRLGR